MRVDTEDIILTSADVFVFTVYRRRLKCSAG